MALDAQDEFCDFDDSDDIEDEDEDNDDGDRKRQNVIRRKSSKPLLPIPYDRPVNRLKQLSYRLALEVHDKNREEALIQYVKDRDKEFMPYRGVDPPVTEWALRLAVVKSPRTKKQRRLGKYSNPDAKPPTKYSEYLVSPSQLTKFSSELLLAHSLDIDWRNVTMFISAIGGYDYILAGRLPKNLGSKTWVKGLMRRRPVDITAMP